MSRPSRWYIMAKRDRARTRGDRRDLWRPLGYAWGTEDSFDYVFGSAAVSARPTISWRDRLPRGNSQNEGGVQ